MRETSEYTIDDARTALSLIAIFEDMGLAEKQSSTW